MPDLKPTAFPTLASLASGDIFTVVDVSDTTDDPAGSDTKMTAGNVVAGLAALGGLATDAEVASAISALSSVYQPLDSDLTAIAALSTTSFGRGLLVLADAAAARTALGLVIGTDVAAQSSLASYQPLDSDLTAIAALTTTSFGRSLLALADAAAGRTALGLGSLATLSTITTTQITDGTIVDADINASAAIALSKLATDPLARANHTGTQTASTISDFAEVVRDTMGTALVAGSNVTITVSDPSDTITIAATGGGSFSFDDSGAWLASQFWS